MALNNPAFNTPAFQDPRAGAQTRYSPPAAPAASAAAAAEAANLEGMYTAPAAGAVETDRMTIEDTVFKTLALFGVLVVGAVVGWIWSMAGVSVANPSPSAAPMIVGGLVGFVLAMVAIFKKKPSVPVFLAYAAFEGLFVGGISAFFEFIYPGIVIQATLATLSVVGVTLALFASGKVRASARATKIFLIAMVGYMVFGLLNIVLMLFNAPIAGGAFGMYSTVKILGIPLGVIIGVVVVIMAAYSLVLDFDQIQRGVRNGAARVYGWVGAFGIMVTVVWLYVEILRLIAILRGNN
ncbi:MULTISPECIES: Bax inhibitor-1/YccA family protein [Microbacterium]|uniref:Bax inhibitor-1/YccA family protein n=1 Tax=Microbacterium TaxID=33882 RepID=UPI0023D9BEFC|nr:MULTISPECIES: Bax inhibitor-1/YccA family protein [Microbacterium]MDF2045351.1 Bax inhibitor-1/YccA family protein [Microbacterium sp. Kw_RZR3]MDQ1074233.1 putative YccA/Bax inhibitor family protein [Microbacterium sp. SORGH_AS_0969]MDQ1114460.1 putative YccA/Bax inhibitor family protein [Microbacterium testaceum]